MPRQNRVSPTGILFADAARGTLMGNRGILHDAAGRIGPVRWKHRNWVTCTLDTGGGPPRRLMAPGSYTELFFLDEATALAAGHRPCAQCRRTEFRNYRDAFTSARDMGARATAPQIDVALHVDRVDKRTKCQKTFRAPLSDLPNGTFVLLDSEPHVVVHDACLRWTPSGYDARRIRKDTDVTVLTPLGTVEVLRDGYRAGLHSTAKGLSASG